MLFRPFAAKKLRHKNTFNPFAMLTRTLDRAAPLLPQSHVAVKRRLTKR
jgi:hypothetical protein